MTEQEPHGALAMFVEVIMTSNEHKAKNPLKKPLSRRYPTFYTDIPISVTLRVPTIKCIELKGKLF